MPSDAREPCFRVRCGAARDCYLRYAGGHMLRQHFHHGVGRHLRLRQAADTDAASRPLQVVDGVSYCLSSLGFRSALIEP